MIVTKSDNTITLQLTKQEQLQANEDIINIYNDDDLFWNDLRIEHSPTDGWTYLLDDNKIQIGSLDDYAFNAITELQSGLKCEITMKNITKDDKELFDKGDI